MNSHQPPPSAYTPGSPDRRSHAVRRRIGKSLGLIVVAAAVLCVLVVWQRDARAIESECRHLSLLVEPVRQFYKLNRSLPLTFSAQADDDSTGEGRFTYVDQDVIRWAQTAKRPVLIAYARVFGLIARPNGHAVAIFDNGNITVEWMPGAEVGPLLREQEQLARAARSDPN